MGLVVDIVLGLLLFFCFIRFVNWKVDRDLKFSKFSPRTPLWARYNFPNFGTWSDSEWKEWSAKTGVSKQMWLSDPTRSYLITNRTNP